MVSKMKIPSGAIKLEGDFSLENIRKMVDEKVNCPGIYFLILTELVKSEENYDIVKDIIVLLASQKKLSWRHQRTVIRFLSGIMGKDEFYEYYGRIIFPVSNILKNKEMIPELINIDKRLLDFYVGKYYLQEKVCEDRPEGEYKANLADLKNDIEKFIKRKFSQKGLDRFLKVFPKKKYDIVFDGNNVLLNKCGRLESESHSKLLILLEQCRQLKLRPLVFIHKRNVKTMKKMGLSLDFPFASTPYRYDDDWFSLYYSICNNVTLVSRDHFRNHINTFDTLKKKDNLKIFLHQNRMNIKKDFSSIIFTKTVLPIIIKENENYYIPGINGYSKV